MAAWAHVGTWSFVAKRRHRAAQIIDKLRGAEVLLDPGLEAPEVIETFVPSKLHRVKDKLRRVAVSGST